MNPILRAPQRLKIVAYSLMIEGFLWMALMVVESLYGGVLLNPLAFVALIGWSLLRLNRAAYRWAFVFVWFYLVLSAIGGWLVLLFIISDKPSGETSLMLIFCGLGLALKVWQLNVLQSPPVCRTFELRDEFDKY